MCDTYVTTVWESSFWDCEGVEQSSERLDFVSSVGVVGGEKKPSERWSGSEHWHRQWPEQKEMATCCAPKTTLNHVILPR